MYLVTMLRLSSLCNTLLYPVVGQLFSLSQFEVTLPSITILLDDVMCTGNETSLLQCSHNGFNSHNCYHDEDIVLACIGKRSP